MAYRKKAKSGSRKTTRAKAATRRKAVKKTQRPRAVKLVIEHPGTSAVARPDGIAGAFQIADRSSGRARY